MSEIKDYFKDGDRLRELSHEYSNFASVQDELQKLTQINEILSSFSIYESDKWRILMNSYLAAVAKAVISKHVRNPNSLKISQQIILKVVEISMKIFQTTKDCEPFNEIKYLLTAYSPIFQDSYTRNAAAGEAIELKFAITKFKKSPFFLQLMDFIIQSVNNNFKVLPQLQPGQILQFTKFFQYLLEYVNSKVFINLIVHYLQYLQNAILSESEVKQDYSFEYFKQISKLFSEATRMMGDKSSILRRVNIIGPRYCHSLIKSANKQYKSKGAQILNMFAKPYTLFNQSYLSQTQFSNWIDEFNLFDELYLSSENPFLFQNTENIFKSYVKSKKLTEKQTQNLIELIFNQNNLDLKRFVCKNLTICYLQPFSNQMILKSAMMQRPIEFYDEDFVAFLANFTKYIRKDELQKKLFTFFMDLLIKYYDSFTNPIIKKKLVDGAYSLFQKQLNAKSADDKAKLYIAVYQIFIQHPQVGILHFLKHINQSAQSSISSSISSLYSHHPKVSKKVVQELNFLQTAFKLLNQKDEAYKHDLVYIMKTVMKKYKSDSKNNSAIESVLLKSVNHPELFEEFVNSFNQYGKMQQVFQKLTKIAAKQTVDISIIKALFYKINMGFCHAYEDENFKKTTAFCYSRDAKALVCYDNLFQLFYQTQDISFKEKLAEFISNIHTSFKQNYLSSGKARLKEYLIQNIHALNSGAQTYLSQKSNQKHLISTLILVNQLMCATQVLGLGRLKSHCSLVGTSTSQIKIHNNVTYGYDVGKIFQKSFSSNTILFDVLKEAGQIFKCGPQSIVLKDGSFTFPLKYNGMTLEELRIQTADFHAYKNYDNRLEHEPYLKGNKLSPKFIECLTQIFNRFAYQGKMGAIECVQYLKYATQSQITTKDGRVRLLFDEYDTDKDGILTLENFLYSYERSLNGISYLKQFVTKKNLENLRYRIDFKKYDADIDFHPQQETCFRYFVEKNENFYHLLFKLANTQNEYIKKESMKLINHLPTYVFSKQTNQVLQFDGKTQFQKEYLLISTQKHLTTVAIHNSDDFIEGVSNSKIHSFIKVGNDKIVFKLLEMYEKIENPTDSQKKCLFICFQVLRSLIQIQNLIEFKPQSSSFSKNKIPHFEANNIFAIYTSKALQNANISNYQSLIALQLTQKQIDIDEIMKGSYHSQKQIRKITTNFLFCWHEKCETKPNLFAKQIKQTNCQEYFQLLCVLLSKDNTLNRQKILEDCLMQLENREQSISSFDSKIYGYVKMIGAICNQKDISSKRSSIVATLKKLMQKVFSSQNRKQIYVVLGKIDIISLLDYSYQMIVSTDWKSQCKPKDYFLGIKNLGSICYMNSVLQVFYMIQEFRDVVLHRKPAKQPQKTEVNNKLIVDDFFYQLQQMYFNLNMSLRNYYNPQQFCLALKDIDKKPINTSIQEDAHQFLSTMFSKMEDELKITQELDLMKSIFHGTTNMEIQCSKCKNKIEKIEQFYNISLEVKNFSTLHQSLKKFTQMEDIQDYFCQKCEQKVKTISKKTNIHDLPHILILNLQRIVYDFIKLDKTKVHSRLQFPFELDINEYLSASQKHQNSKYTLKGVVIHTGTSEGGHYYSLIKNGGNWFKFNDQTVSIFDLQDFQRQAFGGVEVNDGWSSQNYSTNAYILFYQKLQKHNAPTGMMIENALTQKIMQDNNNFLKEYQLHQNGFIESMIISYNEYRPTDLSQKMPIQPFTQPQEIGNRKHLYQKFYQIFAQLFKFVAVFTEVQNQLILNVGGVLFELYHLLPQKSYQTLMNFKEQEIFQQLCTHNNLNYRIVLKSILGKILFIFSRFNGLTLSKEDFQAKKVIFTLQNLLTASSRYVQENIYKSTAYFELWEFLIKNDIVFLQFALQNDLLGMVLEIMMGKESPFAKSHPKRQQVPVTHIQPILNIIAYLSQFKLNFKGIPPVYPNNPQNLLKMYPLTENQQKILSLPAFWKRITNNKYDSEIWTPFICNLSAKDEDQSLIFAQFLLDSLSKRAHSQNIQPLLNHLKYFLWLNDDLDEQRFNWLLGVPQIKVFDNEGKFGLHFSIKSDYLNYVSGLFFNEKSEYKTFLQALYEQRQYLNAFSLFGLNYLLDIMILIDKVFDYIMKLPPPCYSYHDYLGWIPQFLRKIEFEEVYLVGFDKKVWLDRLHSQYNSIVQKIRLKQLKSPKFKYIIGKSTLEEVKQVRKQDFYDLTYSECTTYVLQNLPTGSGKNLSLEEDFDSYSSRSHAKLFINSDHSSIMYVDKQIVKSTKKQKTIIRLGISTSKKLKIRLKTQDFRHQIFVSKGKTNIYIPYQEATLNEIIDITVIQKEAIEEEKPKIDSDKAKEGSKDLPVIVDDEWLMADNYQDQTNTAIIKCKKCTFDNPIDKAICDMCFNALYD